MQIQVKQSYKGQNISSLYRFPFVYSKRPIIGPADYWSLTQAGEGIDERESGKFEEGLNSKVKLSLYRTFGKIVE